MVAPAVWRWSAVNQQDDIGRPVINTDTDNGKTFSTIDGYTPLGDLQREIFGSAGNSFVKYDYFPTTSTPTNGSPDALQTMTVTPASGSPAATGYTYDTNTKQTQDDCGERDHVHDQLLEPG